jgi:hypothetical protein
MRGSWETCSWSVGFARTSPRPARRSTALLADLIKAWLDRSDLARMAEVLFARLEHTCGIRPYRCLGFEASPERLAFSAADVQGNSRSEATRGSSMPRTAILLGMLMLLARVACTTMVRPGLANAAALGGTPVDARVHDVIANGGDSCERRLGPGPLRNEVPACPTARTPVSDAAAGRYASSMKEVTVPWVEHYYTHWPCSSRHDEHVGRVTLAGSFASPAITSDRAFGGATCAVPWDEK